MRTARLFRLAERESEHRDADDPDQWLRVAGDPEADPADLTWIAAMSDDREVWKLIADNPAAAEATATVMVAKVLDGSRSDARISWLDTLFWIEVVRLPRTLRAIAEHEGTEHAVAANPATPTDVLARYAEECVDDTATDSDANGRADYSVMRERLALHPSTPVNVLDRLARDESAEVRRLVARNRSTPTETLDRLAGDVEWSVRGKVAINPAAHPETLARLGGERSASIRVAVARNPGTTVEALRLLAGDRDKAVRTAAGRRLKEARRSRLRPRSTGRGL